MGDASGNRVEGPYTYDAYGNGAPASGVPYKYTGRRLDAETGLYYYRARMYSPALGRFLQTDPIGYGDNLNLYAYVGNDPVNKTDPQGRESACVYSGQCDQWGDLGYLEPFEPVMTFITGVGPKVQNYGMGSDMARAAQRSEAAGIIRQRVARALDHGRAPRPGGVYFGPAQYVAAGMKGDTFSHVMGSVNFSAQNLGGGQVQFTITNEMTTSSFLGSSAFQKLLNMPGVAQQIQKLNHNRGPGATVKITVAWKEHLQKHTCTGSRIQQYEACQ